VLRALRGQLPQEDYFYFADTRFLSYGDRPESFLKERGMPPKPAAKWRSEPLQAGLREIALDGRIGILAPHWKTCTVTLLTVLSWWFHCITKQS